MKSMTCKQLGGACELVFRANTFEEMAQLSKKHGSEMFKNGDDAHLKAMNEMKVLMESPEKMQKWFDDRRVEFDALPNEE